MARTRTVRIPMSPGWDSLNVAVAGAIALQYLADLGD
jgi:tRNA G18 (ribose-2'-O)-methylase SpoU